MRSNVAVVVVALSLLGLVGVLSVDWNREQQRKERLAEDGKRSFRIINLHDGDVLTDRFTITADVLGSAYGYTDVWLVVDGKSIDSMPSRLMPSGRHQMQFMLRTNEFWNGVHSVCLAGPDGKMQCRKVTFRNKNPQVFVPGRK